MTDEEAERFAKDLRVYSKALHQSLAVFAEAFGLVAEQFMGQIDTKLQMQHDRRKPCKKRAKAKQIKENA